LNLISQRLDTIYQIKPKHATILFLHLFTELNTPFVKEAECVVQFRTRDGHQSMCWIHRVCLVPRKGVKKVS
jgi:hypothetical protein